jgi:hypothetical protein
MVVENGTENWGKFVNAPQHLTLQGLLDTSIAAIHRLSSSQMVQHVKHTILNLASATNVHHSTL